MSDTEEKKFRRNYKACLNCRTRKVKCDLGSVDAPNPPCVRCKRERKECVFAESKRGGSNLNNLKKKRKVEIKHSEISPVPILNQSNNLNYNLSNDSFYQKPDNKQVDEANKSIPPARSSEFSTMQGALVFLARAAGTMAKADDRDNISASEIHKQIENQESNSSSAINSPISRQNSNMEINKSNFDNNHFAPLIRPNGLQPANIPPVSSAATVHPKPTKKLSDISYIGENKMLTEFEAIRLINLFFLTLHPYFPHIPDQLHSPDVLAGYPILLCAILTISARYHPFENENQESINKNSRNIQLHERLWIYCKRLISQTVWAEASTRSIGTALAFLLFTEWNPRAIHWRWSDYANNSSDYDYNKEQTEDEDDEDEAEGFAGLSAMRRSDRMAWMLIGTSVRLSQDMGFIRSSPDIFVASHISETNTAMNLGQRSMLSQSLGEIDLDNEDDNELEGAKFDPFVLSLNEDLIRKRSLNKKPLKFTFSQKAKLEILKIMSLAYETIYLGNTNLSRQNLTVLQVLSPLIDNWYRSYKKLLKPSNPKNFNHHCNLNQANNIKHVNEITRQIDKESVICDYYYCQLYIYSLALSMENPLNTNIDVKKPLNNIKLDEISKASKFVEIAYNSAKEILNAAIRIHKLKLLKYMPVRWVTRIVRSVAFIVKCFLTLTNRSKSNQQNVSQGQTSAILTLSIIPIEDILQTIQKAAIVLREASPDELHLCTRYSTILMYLCTEMKHRTKFSTNVPEIRKLEVEEEEEVVEPNYLPQKPLFTSDQQTPLSYPEMNTQLNEGLPETVIDWFLKNDEAIGLDFVEPWTEMLEQQLGKKQ